MSSGCVLRKVSQSFTCEKNCNSVEARKALLKDFTSKVYSAEVVYVGSDGKTTEENYTIDFKLSEKQKDSTMNIIYGIAILQKEGETPINLTWIGKYLAKKNGYKIKLSGENIEKEFYLYCDGNETINFLIKKTVSETSETVRQLVIQKKNIGGGAMINCNSVCEAELNNCSGPANLCKDLYNSCKSICKKKL